MRNCIMVVLIAIVIITICFELICAWYAAAPLTPCLCKEQISQAHAAPLASPSRATPPAQGYEERLRVLQARRRHPLQGAPRGRRGGPLSLQEASCACSPRRGGQELTVLGFIALLVFMAVKTGIPQSFSRQVRPHTRPFVPARVFTHARTHARTLYARTRAERADARGAGEY